MRQKGFSPIIFILILAFLGVAGYFLYNGVHNPKFSSPISESPKTLDTSSWKTYVNHTKSFSFKYPSDFTEKGEVHNNSTLSLTNKDYLFTLYINNEVSFYKSEVLSIKSSFEAKDLSVNVKNIGPYVAYLKSEQSAGGNYSFVRTAIIPMQDDIVVIAISPKDESKFLETEDLTDQILSTFRFIQE